MNFFGEKEILPRASWNRGKVEVIHGPGSDVADPIVILSDLHVYCGMAFPVPLHVPKKQPTDVSSAILNRISDADSKSLNAALAHSWIVDLDQSILAAKVSLCPNLRSFVAQPVLSNSSMREFKETFLLSNPSSRQPSQFATACMLSRTTQASCPTLFPIPRYVHMAWPEDVEDHTVFSQVSRRISSER